MNQSNCGVCIRSSTTGTISYRHKKSPQQERSRCSQSARLVCLVLSVLYRQQGTHTSVAPARAIIKKNCRSKYERLRVSSSVLYLDQTATSHIVRYNTWDMVSSSAVLELVTHARPVWIFSPPRVLERRPQVALHQLEQVVLDGIEQVTTVPRVHGATVFVPCA